MEVKINLNQWVKFKLTDYGKDIYYHRFDELNKYLETKGNSPLEPTMPEVDKDGYSKMQLWCFIELYGQHIGMGKRGVIEHFDLIFDIEKESEM